MADTPCLLYSDRLQASIALGLPQRAVGREGELGGGVEGGGDTDQYEPYCNLLGGRVGL